MNERDKKYANPKETFVVHPDVIDFYRHYQPGDDFTKISQARKEKTEDGEDFYNTGHDEEMKETAQERSWKKHLVDPWPKRR